MSSFSRGAPARFFVSVPFSFSARPLVLTFDVAPAAFPIHVSEETHLWRKYPHFFQSGVFFVAVGVDLAGLILMDQSIASLRANDTVAVMPLDATSASDVLAITTVSTVRETILQLANGKLYAREDGRGLVTNDCIVPATEAHRTALRSRGGRA
jgi:hypothetical protein